MEKISKRTGLSIEMISLFEDNLMKLRLIGARRGPDNSNVETGMGFRMSALGLEMCGAITKFQKK